MFIHFETEKKKQRETGPFLYLRAQVRSQVARYEKAEVKQDWEQQGRHCGGVWSSAKLHSLSHLANLEVWKKRHSIAYCELRRLKDTHLKAFKYWILIQQVLKTWLPHKMYIKIVKCPDNYSINRNITLEQDLILEASIILIDSYLIASIDDLSQRFMVC